MLNIIWVALILLALAAGALTGKLDLVTRAATDSAGDAVKLAIGLVGVMAFWLGMMRVLQEGGLLGAMARLLRPVTKRLFPDVPAEHPAMSMMILNFTSNMLGLANAATPFGVKAMMELDKLNPKKGTATPAMALFLAINTSGLALLPTGMVGLRSSLGSVTPGSIIITTLVATSVSTFIAIVCTKLIIHFKWWPGMRAEALAASSISVSPPSEPQKIGAEEIEPPLDKEVRDATALIEREPPKVSTQRRFLSYGLALGLLALLGLALLSLMRGTTGMALIRGLPALDSGVSLTEALKTAVSSWAIVILIGMIVLFGVARNVKVYDAVVEGGKEGFGVALRIIPYLVAMLVAVGMLRASGAIDLMSQSLENITQAFGMPAETLPMALLRPLSGSGAFAVAAEIMKTHGPDSLIGTIVSTIQGSSETTFYVLAVYFGAIQVSNIRFTLIPCILADIAGVLASVWACRLLLF